MRTKRVLAVAAAAIIVLAIIGLLSNAMSARAVEKHVQKECDSSITQTARLWHLSVRDVRHLPSSSIRMRADVTPKGKRVNFQLPPREQPPFSYAHAEQVAPFVFRVQYGWAVAGSRMTFGQGGEQKVISVFGITKTVRDRPAWNF